MQNFGSWLPQHLFFIPNADMSNSFRTRKQIISQDLSSWETPAGPIIDSVNAIAQTANMNTNVVTAVTDTLTRPDKQATKIVDLCVLRDAFVDFVSYSRRFIMLKLFTFNSNSSPESLSEPSDNYLL